MTLMMKAPRHCQVLFLHRLASDHKHSFFFPKLAVKSAGVNILGLNLSMEPLVGIPKIEMEMQRLQECNTQRPCSTTWSTNHGQP